MKFNVELSRLVTVRQYSTVEVEAQDRADVGSEILDGDYWPEWKNGKIVDSDGWEIEDITEIK